jgi:hypothetical protein
MMTGFAAPSEFDWVKARASCSLSAVFKELQLGAQSDVQTVGSLSVGGRDAKFVVTNLVRGRFSVVREEGSFSESVNFVLANGAITVRDDQDTILVSGTITLNNAGQCRLKVDQEELELWQFRRMAMEKIFFAPRTS